MGLYETFHHSVPWCTIGTHGTTLASYPGYLESLEMRQGTTHHGMLSSIELLSKLHHLCTLVHNGLLGMG